MTTAQRGWIVVVAIAVAAVVAVLAVYLTQGDDGDDLLKNASPVSGAGVTLLLPEGWAFQDDGQFGIQIAETAEQFSADTTIGPRVLVEVLLGGSATFEQLLEDVAADPSTIEIVEDPDEVQVGGVDGVTVGLVGILDDVRTRNRFHIVNVDGERVFAITLKAPEAQWDAAIDLLEAVLNSVTFDAP